MEDSNNIMLVCKECAEDIFPNKGRFDVQIGDFVKLEFITESLSSEYMWVEVIKADKENNKYEGRLDNDPVLVGNIKYNDKVKFRKEDILNVLRK